MIARLRGKPVARDADGLVLDVGGVLQAREHAHLAPGPPVQSSLEAAALAGARLAPKRFMYFSMRPAVSTNFCCPV